MTYQFERTGELKMMTEEELAEADRTSSIVVFDRGVNRDGRSYWLYILLKPSKYIEYMRLAAAKNRKPMKFDEYGELLDYGYDKDVPVPIKQKMKELYGCDENYPMRIEQEVEKARTAYLKEEREKDTARFKDLATMLKEKQASS